MNFTSSKKESCEQLCADDQRQDGRKAELSFEAGFYSHPHDPYAFRAILPAVAAGLKNVRVRAARRDSTLSRTHPTQTSLCGAPILGWCRSVTASFPLH